MITSRLLDRLEGVRQTGPDQRPTTDALQTPKVTRAAKVAQ